MPFSDSPAPLLKVILLQLGVLELFKTTDLKLKPKNLSVTMLLIKPTLDHHLDPMFKLKTVIHHLLTLIAMMTSSKLEPTISSQEITDTVVTKERSQKDSKPTTTICS